MHIAAVNFNKFTTTKINCNRPLLQNSNFSNLQPLAQDTVSFKGTPDISPALKEAIKKEDYVKVFDELEYEAEKDPKTGKLTITEYSQPSEDETFADYGINEQKLFNSIKNFEGETIMKNSSIVKLGDQNFEFLNIENSKVKDLGKAKIGVLALNPEQAVNLKFDKAQIEDLYIMEKDSVCDKLSELIQQSKGRLYYFPGTENTYQLIADK